MAQDRIKFLADRLTEQAAVGRVILTARSVVCDFENRGGDMSKMDEGIMRALVRAMGDLWEASRIELPDC